MKESVKILRDSIKAFEDSRKNRIPLNPFEKGRVIKALLETRTFSSLSECAKVLRLSERNAYRFYKYATEVNLRDQKKLIKSRASIREIDQFIKVTNHPKVTIEFGKSVTFRIENINNLATIDRLLINSLKKQILSHNKIRARSANQ